MKPSDLSEFFNLLGKAKKEKEEEFDNLLKEADINLDDLTSSLVSGIKEAKEDQKKQKKNEEKLIEQLDSIIDVIENPKEVKDITEPAVTVGVPEDFDVTTLEDADDNETVEIIDIIKPEPIKTPEISDTVAQAIKFIEETNIKEEIENSDDTNLDKLKIEIKQVRDILYKVLAHGPGSGEVRVLKMDDVDEDSAKVDGKVLQYQSSSGKFVGVGMASTDNVRTGILDVAGIATFRDGVQFDGNVSIAGTLTYEDVTNVDSVGLITARGGIKVGSGITLSPDGDIFAVGVSTFSNDITFTGANHNIVFDKSDDRLELADGAEISFGDSEDFKIHYEFNRTLARQHGNGPFVFDLFNQFNFIHITGGQLAEDIAKFIPNGPIELYHDNTKRFSTSGIGATVFGQLDTTSNVAVGSGVTLSPDGDVFTTGISTFTGTVGFGTHITLEDDAEIRLGERVSGGNRTGDFIIRHDPDMFSAVYNVIQSNNGNIQIENRDTNGATRFLYLKSDAVQLRSYTGNEAFIQCTLNQDVKLYYDNSEKLATADTGVDITGTLTATSNVNVGSGVTLSPDGDGFYTGIVTATSFVGGLPITNGADNRVITATSASAIQGEAGLTFNGTTLSNAGTGFKEIKASTSTNNSATLRLQNSQANYTVSNITGGSFSIGDGSGTKFTINSSGTVGINNDLEVTSDISIPNDTGKIKLGASQDLEINHNGTHSFIKDAGTGSLFVLSDSFKVNSADASENMIVALENSFVKLFFNGSNKLETTNTGITVTGTTVADGADINGDLDASGTATLGSGGSGQAILQYQGSTKLTTQTWGVQASGTIQAIGNLEAANTVSETEGKDINIKNLKSGGGVKNVLTLSHASNNSSITGHVGNISINAPLVSISTHFSVAGVSTFNGLVKLPDSSDNQTGRLMFGDGTDLQIFHTGSAGEIGNFTGNLNVKSNSFRIFNGAANQVQLRTDQNDSVILYHSGNEKIKTTNTGAVVTGILTATSFEDGNGIGINTANVRTGILDVAGISTFRDDIKLPDDTFVRLGDLSTGDFTINHDGDRTMARQHGIGAFVLDLLVGGNAFIITRANLTATIAKFTPNGSVDLYFDGTKRFETTDSGAEITGDLEVTNTASGTGLKLIDSSSKNFIAGGGGGGSPFSGSGTNHDFRIQVGSNQNAIFEYNADERGIFKLGPASGIGITFNGASGNANFAGITTSITSSVIGSHTSPLTIGAVSSHHLTVANDNASMILGKSNSDALYLRREYATGRYTFQTFNGGNDGSIALQPFGGKVGIASAIPTSTLDVNGDVRVGSGVTLSPDGDIFVVGVSTFVGNLEIRPSNGQATPKIYYDDSIADALIFQDNVQARFGGSSDLRIYHDGSQSIIQDAGTGQLRISGENTVAITNANGTESYGRFIKNGQVELFYDNTKRIETTDSGAAITGDLTVSGSVSEGSDIRLKTNIKPIEDPIDKVTQIEGVSFNWKKDNKPSLGVIADQVEKIIPELVQGDDPKTVNYNGLIGLLIEAVKDQQTQIDSLKERLSKLE